jgi:tetratricopeptide (TPR) repeat protein
MFLREWEWVGAERSLLRALALDREHSFSRLFYGRLLEAVGKLQEGLDVKLGALKRDAFSPLIHLEIAMSHFNQRLYDGAIEWASKTLHLDPHHLLAHELVAAPSRKVRDVSNTWMSLSLEALC